MTERTHPITPPVGGLYCRNCGDEITATHHVYGGGMSISGLKDYRWTHAHGSDTCLPKTTAEPWDGWHATSVVEAAIKVREDAEDALELALTEENAR